MMFITFSSFILFTLSSAFVAAEKDIISERFFYPKTSAQYGKDTPSNEGNADKYMDEVFRELKEYMDSKGLNEIALPDKLLQFKKTVLGVDVHGKIGLNNGYIVGVDTIHRTGDANIIAVGDDLKINVTAGVTNARLGYSGVIEFMGLSHDIPFSGTVDESSALCLLTDTNIKNLTLDSIHVLKIGHITVDISGLGKIFNFLAELVSDTIVNLTKNVMVKFFEGPLKEEIQTIIDRIPFDPFLSDV